MSEVWGLVGWAVTTAIAIGGLWLGIRAERRASKYRPHWDVKDERDTGLVTITNRTGESARDISLVRLPGGFEDSSATFALVADGESVSAVVAVHHETMQLNPHVYVRWTRATTGASYRWDDVPLDGRKLGARLRDGVRNGLEAARRKGPRAQRTEF